MCGNMLNDLDSSAERLTCPRAALSDLKFMRLLSMLLRLDVRASALRRDHCFSSMLASERVRHPPHPSGHQAGFDSGLPRWLLLVSLEHALGQDVGCMAR